jgi:hypothetical protein
VQPVSTDNKDVGQTPLAVTTTEELKVFAQVLSPIEARLAVATNERRFHRHSVANSHPLDRSAHFDDDANDLVAGIVWGLAEDVLAVVTSFVRPTNATSGKTHQRFTGSQSGHWFVHDLYNIRCAH